MSALRWFGRYNWSIARISVRVPVTTEMVESVSIDLVRTRLDASYPRWVEGADAEELVDRQASRLSHTAIEKALRAKISREGIRGLECGDGPLDEMIRRHVRNYLPILFPNAYAVEAVRVPDHRTGEIEARV